MNYHEMLRKVSRTFALSIEQLPGVLGEAVAIAYLLFRVADCIEDHPSLRRERKAELLHLWARVLRKECQSCELTGALSELDGSDPEVYIAQHAGEILAYLSGLPDELAETLMNHVHKTSIGMARWQEHGPYVQDENEMDDYMHEVAGRVGYLLTDLFSWHSPSIGALKEKLMPLGREFGLALQTVNIIRGMRKDYERGWVFVPAAFYRAFGLTRESLFDPANSDRAMKVIDMLADKAERHLFNGLRYTALLPPMERNIRLFCIWPLLFAVKTLALSRNNHSVMTSEAKITRAQVTRIVYTSKLFFWSNTLLSFYYKRLLKPGPA